MEQQIQERVGKSVVKGRRSRTILWKVLGSSALVLAVAGLIVNLHDIKRYIRISTM